MSEKYVDESLTDIYIFETVQLIEQLEQLILSCEKTNDYSSEYINEVFRIMHTIKGSSSMMFFQNITALAHSIEDLFYFIREEKNLSLDFSNISDLILYGVDFIKGEIEKLKSGVELDGDATSLTNDIKLLLSALKEANACKSNDGSIECANVYESGSNQNIAEGKSFKAKVIFEEGCEMENFRALMVVNNLKEITDDLCYFPEDIEDNDDTCKTIRESGFDIYFNSDKTYDEIYEYLVNTTILLDKLQLTKLEELVEDVKEVVQQEAKSENAYNAVKRNAVERVEKQVSKDIQTQSNENIISVNIGKVDNLMNLVGELVIAEAMVTQNPEIKDLELENFKKASRQLHKIISELQDSVMSIRMVPIANTFNKMQRIVRDMSKKLNKDVELELVGKETEVDKKIIEHISDPLMHLIRNSIDHGIESTEERLANGKFDSAKVILEAKNSGEDILVLVKDNGKGLDRNKILKKANENGLLRKPEYEMTDKEVYNLIFQPGFSTKESVSEFSGRGVGMDVVCKNIESIGGTVLIDSVLNEGTTITLKIPMTLASIGGMNVRVGKSQYIIPTTIIKQFFRVAEKDIITDPNGNEMIMVRGECYPVIRLYEVYKVKTEVTNVSDGIVMIVETKNRNICILVDELIGEHQVVVKALPSYIRKFNHTRGITGCTLLGDGSISLILDVEQLIE
ncbi:chemotaxis protein CheA [Inconstantimicrobium mannanitabidum]|uniref:Chemotaxis protein CheA n=1 Tax=Inconstantimicrobium mannanitabidum TaxID=1604901 RepID=A0ACB5RHJ2_9CLOT|nr:chemotaxis protein CheA [Clostridium sp. TW13]GKX68565.1 chemotaxis protein CheA [Clostridium sp. TW13]